LPLCVKDRNSGELKRSYATYEGIEVQPTEADRLKRQTARLFHLKNEKNEEYQFVVRGNGQYEMLKLSLGERPIAMGTMLDSTPQEITVVAGF
jgi:hypothetical protein